MTDRDIVVELTLQLAQDGREPSVADKARNLAALRARLGLPGAAALPEMAGTRALVAGGVAAGDLATPVAGAALLGGRAAARGLWWLVGASTLTGLVGFVLGLLVAPELRNELDERADAARVVAGVVAADAARARGGAPAGGVAVQTPASADGVSRDGVAGEGVTGEGGVAGEGEPPSVRASPSVSALPSVSASPSVGAPDAEVSVQSVRPRSSRATPLRATPLRARAESSAATSDRDFLDAVRWLRRAQRAVRHGEGALALGLLHEIDTRFPPELLGEERQATRVLGLCGSGEDERAGELARALLADNPRSIYAERLRASCAAPALGASGGQPKKNALDGRE